MYNRKIKEIIVKYYDSEDFQKYLIEQRLEIEKLLKPIVYEVGKHYKILDSLETRIKSQTSFEEKITRKGYLFEWEQDIKDINDDECIRQSILKTLPDPIGFRLYCVFKEDVCNVFNYIRNEIKKEHQLELIDDTSNKQKNGLAICKFTLKYQDVQFELQIKSLVDGLWDEVDHDTFYKGYSYDVYKKYHKNIIMQNNSVLSAVDGQLYHFYIIENDEKELINALFYKYINKQVEAIVGRITMFPYEAILHFLMRYGDKEYSYIKEFVSKKIIGNEVYEKKRIEIEKLNSSINRENVIDYIGERDVIYALKVGYSILSCIIAFDDEDEYYDYIIGSIYKHDVEDDISESEESIPFNNDEDEHFAQNVDEDKDVNEIIKKSIKRIFSINEEACNEDYSAI